MQPPAIALILQSATESPRMHGPNKTQCSHPSPARISRIRTDALNIWIKAGTGRRKSQTGGLFYGARWLTGNMIIRGAADTRNRLLASFLVLVAPEHGVFAELRRLSGRSS
ncbi:hypothetical protein CHU98_g1541 [Xylaria longipes]|nr:hypothetical protein CHU98_g1541 [Xylaria longipes]